MASTCPLCDKPFKTDTERAAHMKKCPYPKDKRKGGNGN